jgi:hydrogenase maturation protease
MQHPEKILVLGLGNDILSDDAIGPKIVYELGKEPFPSRVRFITAAVGGLEILEMVEGYQKLLIIDAIKTANGTPGDIYMLTPEAFKNTLHLYNFHDINFLNALELGRKLNMNLPSEITILAVEIVEDLEFSDRFSPVINERFPEILDEIKRYLINLVASG